VVGDFPAAVGGVITLEADTQYFLVDDIVTSNRFIAAPNTLISAASSNLIAFEYTGTDAFFTVGDFRFTAQSINLTTTTGKLFDLNGSGSARLSIRNCILVGGQISTISNPDLVVLRSVSMAGSSGIEFVGATATALVVDGFLSNIATGAVFDLGTTVFNAVQVENALDTSPAGVVVISGLPNNGNLTTESTGSVRAIDVEGDATPISGLSPDDARWEFALNNKIRDTRRDAIINTQGNALQTTFIAQATPVKVNAVWTSQRLSGFSFDSSGTVTQEMIKGITTPITFSVTAIKASGGASVYTFFMAVDGVPVSATATPVSIDSSTLTNITLIWQQVIEPTQTLELWVQSESGTTSVIVESSIIRVN
jgi:hypothetical protein